jgi:hypothetical protein
MIDLFFYRKYQYSIHKGAVSVQFNSHLWSAQFQYWLTQLVVYEHHWIEGRLKLGQVIHAWATIRIWIGGVNLLKIGRTSVVYLHISAICFQNLLNIIDQCCRNVFTAYFYASFMNIFWLFLTVLRVLSCIVLNNYLRMNSFLHHNYIFRPQNQYHRFYHFPTDHK